MAERDAGAERALQRDPRECCEQPDDGRAQQHPAGPARRAAGRPHEQPEEDGADEQQQRGVVQATRGSVGALDGWAGRRACEQVGDLRSAALRGDLLADAERETAGYGVPVGGDDAVGRRVHAAPEPVAHADADAALRGVGIVDLAAVDALAVLVVDAERRRS